MEELSRSELSNRDFSAAAAASSSCFFFLNRVSAIGRKKVQSNPYCLQCWHKAGSESARTSHLFDGEMGQQVGGDQDRKETTASKMAMGTPGGVKPQLIAVKQKYRTYRILRLRQLSHALCVLVRFLVSGGNGCCTLALGPDAITLGTEPEATAISSEPSASPPWPSPVGLRLRFPDETWTCETGE